MAASGPAISGSTGFTATTEGAAIGITSSMINGYATHNQFTGYDSDFTVFETRGSEVISLGVRNATISDGGITTNQSDLTLTREQLLGYVEDVDLGDTLDITSTSNDVSLTSTLNGDDSVGVVIDLLATDAQFDFTVSDGTASDTATVFVHAQEGTTIIGGATDDILIGQSSDDTMTGNGGDDLFVFVDGGGSDQILDFVAGAGTDDAIDLSGIGALTDYAGTLAASTQVGLDVVINLGGSETLTLAGITLGDLHQDDFLF